MELEKAIKMTEGKNVARCNLVGAGMSASQIREARTKEIDKEQFTAVILFFCEMHQRELSDFATIKIYKTLNEFMGHEEFIAAAQDLFKSRFYFANIIPEFCDHVQQQRDNGPDLMSLEIAEYAN